MHHVVMSAHARVVAARLCQMYLLCHASRPQIPLLPPCWTAPLHEPPAVDFPAPWLDYRRIVVEGLVARSKPPVFAAMAHQQPLLMKTRMTMQMTRTKVPQEGLQLLQHVAC
jgi:hypothetical protein